MPAPLSTRPEGVSGAPCGPLWPEGQKATVRGLYRTSGEGAYLDVAHVQPEGPSCWARFFLDGDLGLGKVPWDAPLYLQLSGWLSAGRWSSPGLWDLKAERWSLLPFDAGAAQQACRQAMAAQATSLGRLDWSALALPGYVTGTVGFHPSPDALGEGKVLPQGVDDGRLLLVMEAEGPELPPVRPLVRRWVAVECLYDLERGRVIHLVATIRGERQE